ncbi:Aste57867_14621 [Aphanomyces stellatus]|uniref:Aste57867_14621 protein n=1 Tax=Aphanomyces stellatus TaxID=120398 RepID=A0A485L1Q6_9STRA|nr:hypothetical protein As57867_014566 [Aphanomyces stellatus]VFT91440.1 Aste57867_14621 [Aphanomyces stellatus]
MATPTEKPGPWDVMEDLQFLIATDDHLQDELTHVCELLGPSPDEQSAASSTSSPGKNRRVPPPRDYHHRAELQHLRREVELLKAELVVAKAKAAQFDMSAWEKAARRERVEKSRSLQENEELRAAVDERESFIQHMKRTISRKPRWSVRRRPSSIDCILTTILMLQSLPDASIDAWQSYKLAAQHSLRVAAIHAIADRQYRRQPNAFIQAGIFDLDDDLFRATQMTPPGSHQVILQVINHVNFAAPVRTVSSACWRTFSGGHGLPLPEDSDETIETIDDHTVYERFWHTQGGVTGHSNNIRKYYPEADRDVIVWRTVLEDALVPHMSKGAVDDTWGWLVVAPLPGDSTKCRMTCLIHIPLDLVLAPRSHAASKGPPNRHDIQTIDAITSTIHVLSRPKPVDDTTAAMASAVASASPSAAMFPAMRTFLERGKLFELAMKASLNEAVARFAQSVDMNESV